MGNVKPIVAKTPEALAKVLGLPSAEAREWKAQYMLLKRLKQIVQKEGITPAEVAQRADISQAQVRTILKGNLEQVSSDLLIQILGVLGYQVSISVSRMKTAA